MKKIQDNSDQMEGFDLDENEINDTPMVEVQKSGFEKISKKEAKKLEEPSNKSEIVNCLRNERIVVKHIPKLSGIWGNNPKHVLSGGIADGVGKTFVVPRLSSGMYVNVLTDDEKAFLEDLLNLEYNALSIYKKIDNFWDDSNDNGINKVRLEKGNTYFNLADPEDYIRYKILLANKDYVAPSMQALQDYPKATYQFVITSDGEENNVAKQNMSATMKCYKEFGKIEDNIDILRTVVETIEGKPTSKATKLEFLQTRANSLIQNNAKLFLSVITDPLLNTKVLIKKGIEEGIIACRGNFLYMRDGNSPLCEHNEEPTLSTAAKYLNSPKHQDLLFALQAKLKQ